MNKYYTAQSCL